MGAVSPNALPGFVPVALSQSHPASLYLLCKRLRPLIAQQFGSLLFPVLGQCLASSLSLCGSTQLVHTKEPSFQAQTCLGHPSLLSSLASSQKSYTLGLPLEDPLPTCCPLFPLT